MKLSPENFDASPARARCRNQRGVALVVTLILLAVVTFLATAFLFLARRERGSVTTTLDQTAARRAAEAATEHAKVAVLASIIQSNSQFYYGLIVSTNFINTNGFITTGLAFTSLTNVNYDYLANGSTNFTPDQRNQNIANLFYSPRPPVFVRPGDFRFYLDLNQSGRDEANGLLPEVAANGGFVTTLDTNGNSVIVTNFYVGDPEWIGVLERSDRSHSASNRFLIRYCYLVVPSGKTLDLNSIHNQSKQTVAALSPLADGFSRNMGVGPWELNLAAFFVGLNTNVWEANVGGPGSLPPALINPSPYFYDTTPLPGLVSSTGTSFEDAVALTRYRYGGNLNNLKSVDGLFGPSGVAAFTTDLADGYGSGPLLLTNSDPAYDGDGPTRVSRPWPGAENPNHFFTTQDLFDRNKTTGAAQASPNTFADRLLNAGYYGVSSYDRYTYYRLLSQLGADSSPDPTITNKMHLNYDNVDLVGNVIPDKQTNFVAWSDAAHFFTNAADRLLRATFPDKNVNLANFGVAAVPTITSIPVLINNRFVYTPAMHRVLQVTANLWDAMTNGVYPAGSTNIFPTVFSPIFSVTNNDVYITGFEELTETWSVYSARTLRDLVNSNVVSSLQPRDRVMGVPLIIGAKKGFPNFNEFAMQNISQVIRKVTLHRNTPTSRPSQTNQLFLVGISNSFAFEAWNPYNATYGRAMDIYATNFMAITLSHTNDADLDQRGNTMNIPLTPIGQKIPVPINTWAAVGPRPAQPATASFKVPLSTNFMVLTNAIYHMPKTGQPYWETNDVNIMNLSGVLAPLRFDNTGDFQFPEFVLSISNRIMFALVDQQTDRIVDYIHLTGLGSQRDLVTNVVDEGEAAVPERDLFWDRTRVTRSLKSPPQGVRNQIDESLNQRVGPTVVWNDYSLPVADKTRAIHNFQVFCGLTPFDINTSPFVQTNLDMQAPYTPVQRVTHQISWQANDPLVHYTIGDLNYPEDKDHFQALKFSETPRLLRNITNLNDRYQPWGGNPKSGTLGSPAYTVEMKDPGVTSADAWDFPTNRFPTLGWIGRVHRGTPWQTVYLKANDVDPALWTKWTGNSNLVDAGLSRPIMDRALLDVFTTAIDQNSTRGQLNVNQTGLAAWSALLGGVIGLTNVSTEDELNFNPPLKKFEPVIIPPAGSLLAGGTNSVLAKIHDAVDRTRTQQFKGSFKRVGDILAVPELTTASPLLNTNTTASQGNVQLERGLNDAEYERLPQMLLGLLRGGDQPSFTIYAYGQTLHPAPRSIVTSGQHFGLCTNYQITAEFATRTVVRVEGAPRAPKVVVESFNILAPE